MIFSQYKEPTEYFYVAIKQRNKVMTVKVGMFANYIHNAGT
jgi:hypothetical protein